MKCLRELIRLQKRNPAVQSCMFLVKVDQFACQADVTHGCSSTAKEIMCCGAETVRRESLKHLQLANS